MIGKSYDNIIKRSAQSILSKKLMKVIEMVNQKIIDNQNVSEAAPESCAGMGFKNAAAMVYERTTPLQFWKYSGLGF